MSKSGPPSAPQSAVPEVKQEATPAQSPDEARLDKELRERLFRETKDELVKKQISNAENFDRSVLTLSSSALGFSVAFIKDLAPLGTADVRWALVGSWSLFGAAVILTMISFMTSQSAIRHQLDIAEKYYLRYDDTSIDAENVAANWTNRFNFFAGASLVLGMILTIVFAIANLPQKP